MCVCITVSLNVYMYVLYVLMVICHGVMPRSVLDGNRLAGPLPAFHAHPMLKVVSLSHNQLEGELPEHWGAVPQLRCDMI